MSGHIDILPAGVYFNQHTQRFYFLASHRPITEAGQEHYYPRRSEFPQFTLPYEIPELHREYRHHNGNIYVPYDVTNMNSDRQDEYPTTISYVGPGKRTWSRPLSRWHQSMTKVE